MWGYLTQDDYLRQYHKLRATPIEAQQLLRDGNIYSLMVLRRNNNGINRNKWWSYLAPFYQDQFPEKINFNDPKSKEAFYAISTPAIDEMESKIEKFLKDETVEPPTTQKLNDYFYEHFIFHELRDNIEIKDSRAVFDNMGYISYDVDEKNCFIFTLDAYHQFLRQHIKEIDDNIFEEIKIGDDEAKLHNIFEPNASKRLEESKNRLDLSQVKFKVADTIMTNLICSVLLQDRDELKKASMYARKRNLFNGLCDYLSTILDLPENEFIKALQFLAYESLFKRMRPPIWSRLHQHKLV